ncbi:MAG TPA: hypothetical protein VHT29_07465 [Solirubrobacteraceae bacterium]|jgi:hypothetical protein|nr:hypothetical protein [Solirubrobacteraceae bacterium]
MATDDEIQNALLAIYSRLDVIEGKVTVIARADREKLLDELEKVVKKDPIIGRIYLALDGRKNQDDIVADLSSSKPAVSRWLAKMSREHGVVEAAKGQRGSNVYRHNPQMEEVLHLSAKVEKWLREIDKGEAPRARSA